MKDRQPESGPPHGAPRPRLKAAGAARSTRRVRGCARRTLVGYSSDSSDASFVSSDAKRDDEDAKRDDDDRRSLSSAAGGKISQTASAEDTDRAGTATPSPKKHQKKWASPVHLSLIHI